MAIALTDIAWEPCFIQPNPDRALESYARRRFGMPAPTVRYFAAVPWVARASIDLHPELGLLMHLDHGTADLIGLVVSQENSCRFCYAAVRAMLWCQGMDSERIRRVEQDVSRADLAPTVRATLEYARAQSRSGPAGARGAWAALRRAGVSAAEAREIAFTVASIDFNNRLHTMAAVPSLPLERMPEQWLMRLLRPLLERTIRRHRHRGERAEAPAAADDAPYGGLVAAFAGSPIAPLLARILQEMLAAPHLSRRCKLLIFAVVSRALPCDVCELEVGRALQREGVDAAALSRVLGTLDAPDLASVERLLLPFTRETLWYEPAVLQRRTRLLREHLTPEQLVEAIGVAALANALCRMAAVVMAEPA